MKPKNVKIVVSSFVRLYRQLARSREKSMPLCRQDIKYLETKHSNYRIIIKTNEVTQAPANQRINPIIRSRNVVPVRRHVFYTLRYSLYISFIFSVMQGWFIHNLRKSYRDLLQQSIECHRNNTELNVYLKIIILKR